MRRPTLLATALVVLGAMLATPVSAAGPSPRIVNGTEVAEGDAPWMVFVSAGPYSCGGSVIDAWWVMTAAHCVTTGGGAVLSPAQVTVTVGREDLDDTSDGEERDIVQVLRHPDWDRSTFAYDVALLRLEEPLTTPVMALADASHADLEAVGTVATVMGYGYTQGGGPTSQQLLQTDVDIQPLADCDGTPSTICAGDLESDPGAEPANDSCNGDSGGPLMVDDDGVARQVGIVSYGPADCGYEEDEYLAAGYARVSSASAFIREAFGVVTAVDAETTEGEDLVVELSLSRIAHGDETVTVTATRDGEPVADDLTVASQTVTFVAGQSTATATFPTVDDAAHEPVEVFVVDLASDDVEVDTPSVAATVHDDDPLVVSLRDATVDEGDAETTLVALTLDLVDPALGGESVRVTSTTLGSAMPGTDVTPLDEVVTFAAGQREAAVEVAVRGDDEVEEDEVLVLAVEAVEGTAVGDVGALTIENDDVAAPPEVRRVAGGDRIATALATSTTRPPGSADVVYLASSTSFPDALVGTPLAHRDGAPLLLTAPSQLDPRVLDEVRRVLAAGGRVRLLGGEAALSRPVEQALVTAGFATDRIAGADRFETAVLVSRELGDVDTVLLATGRDFPDALAAGAAAAAVGGAVLLTDGDVLPSSTALRLAALVPDEYAVGGQAAAARQSATPLFGSDRFVTADIVARTFLPDAEVVGVASGRDFPDALAGGVDVARQGGALLLTEPDRLPETTRAGIGDRDVSLVLLYGGPRAVSSDVEAQVRALVSR